MNYILNKNDELRNRWPSLIGYQQQKYNLQTPKVPLGYAFFYYKQYLRLKLFVLV